jgi:flagellar protein FliS
MMPSANRYLETEVLTAPPQRLRLMLIDHAIRAAQNTLAAWQESRWDDGLDASIRCRELLSELLSGIDASASPLANDVAGIYAFLFNTMTDASVARDEQKLRDVLRILEIERETWRQVCEQAAEPSDNNAAFFTPQMPLAAPAPNVDFGSQAGGFSVEA